jgi:hypothetical protein
MLASLNRSGAFALLLPQDSRAHINGIRIAQVWRLFVLSGHDISPSRIAPMTSELSEATDLNVGSIFCWGFFRVITALRNV